MNETHDSETDPSARLAHKGSGKEARPNSLASVAAADDTSPGVHLVSQPR